MNLPSPESTSAHRWLVSPGGGYVRTQSPQFWISWGNPRLTFENAWYGDQSPQPV